MILAIIFVTSQIQAANIPKYSSNPQKTYAATKLSDKNIKQLYNKLSAKGKDYFDSVLGKDDELYKYHLKHVNSKYKRVSIKTHSIAVFGELGELNSDLRALNIPCTVRYALMAIASGMSAGAADGPLPVADVIGIVASIGGVAVLAYNWPKIEKKWPKIVKAFEKCFKGVKTDVSKAFSKIQVKVQNAYYSKTFDRFDYHYRKHAKEFKDLPGGNGKKPNRNKYYNKAKRFLKAKGRDIIEGENIGHSKNRAKFNKNTLEYLVYDKKTRKIISYYLPRHSVYNARHYDVWAEKALTYALRRIQIR